MDRIALSKRLEGLSSVFAEKTPICRDLKAMSIVLANMKDEDFSKVLNPSFEADKVQSEGTAPMAEQKTASQDAGLYWNKAASTAVANNLLRDVLGMEKPICCDTKRHLTKEQVPDGSKADEKPAQLKDEQTPDIQPVLKSDIYAKSKKTPLRKEATEEKTAGQNATLNKSKNVGLPSGTPEGHPKGEGKHAAEEKKPEEKKTEEKAAAEKPAEKKDAVKEAAKKVIEKQASSFIAEGIELMPTMDEVELSSDEQTKLNKLFE